MKKTTSNAAEKNSPKMPKTTPMPIIAKTVIAGGIEMTRAWTYGVMKFVWISRTTA